MESCRVIFLLRLVSNSGIICMFVKTKSIKKMHVSLVARIGNLMRRIEFKKL